MARYIDADALIEFINKGLNRPDIIEAFGYDAIEILAEIEYTPPADVVPKSEVEKIFEEIQKIFVHRILHNESQYFEGVLDNITKDLDELKKKYTEGESNGSEQ